MIDKSKSNQVYKVEWSSAEDGGSAWIHTKAQLDQVVALIQTKPGMNATIETHLVPRDKGGLVGWLNMSSDGRAPPTCTIRITTPA